MTRISGLFSIVSAVAAVWVGYLTYQSLVASTRAWVGPSKATASIGDDGVVTIMVTYKNVGKEPALKFGDDWADSWAATLDVDSDYFDFFTNCTSDVSHDKCGNRAGWWKREKCDTKAIFQDRVAFPEFEYRHVKSNLTLDRSDRRRIAVIQGCFVYRTDVTFYGSVHRSAFCYYYRVGQSGDEMRACPVGNAAD